MSRTTRKTTSVAAACAVILGSGVGIAVAATSKSGDTSVDNAPITYAATAKPYATQSADAAISDTLAGLNRDEFADIKLGAAPKGTDSQGPWLYVTMKGSTSQAEDIEPSWEAALAQGAIADRIAGSSGDLRSAVSGSIYLMALPDGETRQIGGGSGAVASGQRFGAEARATSDADITAAVQRVLTAHGLTGGKIAVLRPLGPAVSVVATVPDLKKFGEGLYSLQQDLYGSPPQYEGLYLELDSPSGEPLVRSGSDFRTGSGALWFADGMDVALGIAHGGHPSGPYGGPPKR